VRTQRLQASARIVALSRSVAARRFFDKSIWDRVPVISLSCRYHNSSQRGTEFSLRTISKRRSRCGSQPIRRWAFQSCIDGSCYCGRGAWTILSRRCSLLWLSTDCTILPKLELFQHAMNGAKLVLEWLIQKPVDGSLELGSGDVEPSRADGVHHRRHLQAKTMILDAMRSGSRGCQRRVTGGSVAWRSDERALREGQGG
jgi:hypothetical protein